MQVRVLSSIELHFRCGKVATVSIEKVNSAADVASSGAFFKRRFIDDVLQYLMYSSKCFHNSRKEASVTRSVFCNPRHECPLRCSFCARLMSKRERVKVLCSRGLRFVIVCCPEDLLCTCSNFPSAVTGTVESPVPSSMQCASVTRVAVKL